LAATAGGAAAQIRKSAPIRPLRNILVLPIFLLALKKAVNYALWGYPHPFGQVEAICIPGGLSKPAGADAVYIVKKQRKQCT
jgi:hypothetical protein